MKVKNQNNGTKRLCQLFAALLCIAAWACRSDSDERESTQTPDPSTNPEQAEGAEMDDTSSPDEAIAADETATLKGEGYELRLDVAALPETALDEAGEPLLVAEALAADQVHGLAALEGRVEECPILSVTPHSLRHFMGYQKS